MKTSLMWRHLSLSIRETSQQIEFHPTVYKTRRQKMRTLNALLTFCFAVLFTSAVQGQTDTGVNNAELNGNYAFTFSGISGNGSISSVFGAVGRFTADGAGNLTNGELVTHGVSAGAGSPQSLRATYA